MNNTETVYITVENQEKSKQAAIRLDINPKEGIKIKIVFEPDISPTTKDTYTSIAGLIVKSLTGE